MQIETQRFRLRIDNKIVGYQKQIQRTIFYSKDQYAWNGNEIPSQIQDKFTGFFDINRRAIYALDILEFLKSKRLKYGVVLLDETLNQFQLLNMETNEIMELSFDDYMAENAYIFKSYHFIQFEM